MKATVVGYWGAFPKANEATTGYLFEHEGFQLLIDCGSGVVSKLQNFTSLEKLNAVILSHYHHDHIADLGVLQYGRMIKGILGEVDKELPIYGHIQDQDNFEKLTREGVTKGIAYSSEQTLQAGPFSIQFMRTNHPTVCYAMRLTAGDNSVVFTADTTYMEEFIDFSSNADLLIAESSFYDGQDAAPAGHMTCTEAAAIAQRANVGQLLLTHLPHFGNVDELLVQASSLYKGPISLATTGWTWEG